MTIAFLFVATLLLIGVALRVKLAVFRLLYIPASVIAGGLGLGVIQFSTASGWPQVDLLSETLRTWPGILIAIVFAGMLLERKPAPVAESLSRVGRQGLTVWVIVLGQTAIGLLATWLVIQPYADVPNSFGMLIETGFAGGHGTAAAMGQVYAHPTVGLPEGADLGVLMATAGLLYGVLSGIVWVNIGVRRGWVTLAESADQPATRGDGEIPSNKTAIGYAKVGGETIDPLLLQVVWLTLAFGIGMGLQLVVAQAVGVIEGATSMAAAAGSDAEQQLSSRLTLHQVAGSFPLFIYTLFGGWIVRRLLRASGHEDWIDRDTINRLTSSAMDVLIVAAVATLRVSEVVTLLVPFSVLFIGGAVWAAFCLLVVARWLLPREHWFQLGLINYGMSTGTTATGFVLLRLVDPELESGAAEDYAMAAPLSSPFVGGGMITVGLPLLVLENVPVGLSAVGLTAVVIGLIALGRFWNRKSGGPAPDPLGESLS